MPRKPDYKREKKLREAAQRKRNEETEQRKAARKAEGIAPAATESVVPETP
jgi:hypothetical protein